MCACFVLFRDSTVTTHSSRDRYALYLPLCHGRDRSKRPLRAKHHVSLDQDQTEESSTSDPPSRSTSVFPSIRIYHLLCL